MKKEGVLDQSKEAINFWLCSGLLAVLLASILSRDITRPFYGLHSWGEAGGAWKARCYLKYDLEYTNGFAVWAVGNPPREKPNRALDHPQLGRFLPAVEMAIFGINERGLRIGGVIRAVVGLLIFLQIVRGLLDEKTALLAGLLYALFPITGYFGTGLVGELGWDFPLSLLAVWCYLVLIRALKKDNETKKIHKWLLGASLFLALQISWCGFFFAAAIGVHYVFHCIARRKKPEMGLLAILIFAPLLSLMLNFVIMSAGFEWDWRKIISLYQWRAAKGELREFVWSLWFKRFWEYAVTNFTLPVLITAIGYLTFGQLLVFTTGTVKTASATPSRRFPQFWLFLMPAVFQLLVLRGSLWQHQYWEFPLIPFIAIATALGIMLLGDLLGKIHRLAASVGVLLLLVVIFAACMGGVNYYYSIRWQSPNKIAMFKDLNKKIPPDKTLLSFEDFVVNQHPVKGPHYRPEIAWYLDRDIEVVRTIENMERKTETGRYSHYLIPLAGPTRPIINQLSKRYEYEYVPGEEPTKDKKDRFLTAGMRAYFIFDLNSSVKGN
ncbi:MAG: glycosyltransferase family 39 protein [Planctomycetota bacterium]|nr:MAG: glycosyltransferase family 39 protein [Planctomycetota bacterium]